MTRPAAKDIFFRIFYSWWKCHTTGIFLFWWWRTYRGGSNCYPPLYLPDQQGCPLYHPLIYSLNYFSLLWWFVRTVFLPSSVQVSSNDLIFWFGLAWLGLVRFGMVWYGLVWYDSKQVWYGLVWHGHIRHYNLVILDSKQVWYEMVSHIRH